MNEAKDKDKLDVYMAMDNLEKQLACLNDDVNTLLSRLEPVLSHGTIKGDLERVMKEAQSAAPLAETIDARSMSVVSIHGLVEGMLGRLQI